MSTVDVIAVVGACAPERLRYARRLAATTGRRFVPASRLNVGADPIDEAEAVLPWIDKAEGAVVEFPVEAEATHLIGALGEDGGASRLSEIVCVVDAAHLLTDLHQETYVHRRIGPLGTQGTEHTARALLLVMHLEYASTIVLVNWMPLSTPDLSTIMALVCHLAPNARLRLHQDEISAAGAPSAGFSSRQGRPGWVSVLNGDFDPHMTDPRVSAFRYEQLRPLHPVRLMHLLEDRIGKNEFGTVIRSSGFCRLATRPNMIAQWQHVGSMISFAPLASDDRLDDHEELLAIGEDLAFIGLDLDHSGLVAALDEAALSDAELAGGPGAWVAFPDPFPHWEYEPRRPD